MFNHDFLIRISYIEAVKPTAYVETSPSLEDYLAVPVVYIRSHLLVRSASLTSCEAHLQSAHISSLPMNTP